MFLSFALFFNEWQNRFYHSSGLKRAPLCTHSLYKGTFGHYKFPASPHQSPMLLSSLPISLSLSKATSHSLSSPSLPLNAYQTWTWAVNKIFFS